MAQISKSVVTLRITGDDLIPSEITPLLGCKPSFEQTKGQVFIGKTTGLERVAKTGMWNLSAVDYEPENIDAQISEILMKLSQDLRVWNSLAREYRIDLFCGLFMEEGNEGMEIAPLSLLLLGERGIILSLDIYDGNKGGPAHSDLCPCKSGKIYGECCGKNSLAKGIGIF